MLIHSENIEIVRISVQFMRSFSPIVQNNFPNWRERQPNLQLSHSSRHSWCTKNHTKIVLRFLNAMTKIHQLYSSRLSCPFPLSSSQNVSYSTTIVKRRIYFNFRRHFNKTRRTHNKVYANKCQNVKINCANPPYTVKKNPSTMKRVRYVCAMWMWAKPVHMCT